MPWSDDTRPPGASYLLNQGDFVGKESVSDHAEEPRMLLTGGGGAVTVLPSHGDAVDPSLLLVQGPDYELVL
jgi:hypothetical protein